MTAADTTPSTTPAAPTAADALHTLVAELREEGPLVAPLVVDSDARPFLGLLVAAGPRCKDAPEAYATVIEAVREGYLLHYGESRLLPELDPDLRLLVGDHLYARGIEQLAGIGDTLAVNELSDLISMAAQLDASEDVPPETAEIVWLASAVAIAVGASTAHESAKATVRATGNAGPLWEAAQAGARVAGLSNSLTEAAEAVGSPASDLG